MLLGLCLQLGQAEKRIERFHAAAAQVQIPTRLRRHNAANRQAQGNPLVRTVADCRIPGQQPGFGDSQNHFVPGSSPQLPSQ